ncbi:hypothetical protein ACB092_07G133300 [Castanea dentata]
MKVKLSSIQGKYRRKSTGRENDTAFLVHPITRVRLSWNDLVHGFLFKAFVEGWVD